ncbi:MAG TPA: hypothetical protein VE398_18770 [Acidobacteriota bacterium]|nr:hypothetical protein [Acidobacteriota bacterium]
MTNRNSDNKMDEGWIPNNRLPEIQEEFAISAPRLTDLPSPVNKRIARRWRLCNWQVG